MLKLMELINYIPILIQKIRVCVIHKCTLYLNTYGNYECLLFGTYSSASVFMNAYFTEN